MTTADGAPPDTETTRFLGGKLTLVQPRKGYRAAIDPILLAASLKLLPDQHAVEFGCGVGAGLLSAAWLNPRTRFTGIELDPAAAKLAVMNIAQNDPGERVWAEAGDCLSWRAAKSVDAVFFNPPFFDDEKSLRGPDPSRTKAWINPDGLGTWIDAGLKRLKEGGYLTLIQRAERLSDILAALQGRAGDITVLPVHPNAHAPAKRIVVRARKVSKAPLRILPALVLHDEASGSYMPETDLILQGEAQTVLAR